VYLILLLSIADFWFLNARTELLIVNIHLNAVSALVCHTFCLVSCGSFANFDRCKICVVSFYDDRL